MMKRLIILGAIWALAAARPELYKEKEDFQFSRSSSDDGTKSGFYGAQRGNMGGNYERAHNMDSLAQNQMSGLVRQVEGELGDGARMPTGSVYTAANSRGTYGAGHYDLGNLAGRNFQEGESYGDSHRSSSSSSSGYNAAGYTNSRSQNSRRSGYQTVGHSGLNIQSDDLQSLDNLQGSLSSHSSGYNAQSDYQQHSSFDNSNSNSHSGGYGSNTHTRLISATPVRIIFRPGTRVAIPIAAQSYDMTHGSSFDQNSLNSDAEVLTNDNQRLPNNARHYESSYNYRKEWEKHDTIPVTATAILPTIATDSPIPRNSELYEDSQGRTANAQYDARRVDSHRTHSSNIYNGYNANVKSASSQSRSSYDAQNHGTSLGPDANAYTVVGYTGRSHNQKSSLDSGFNGYNTQSQSNAQRYHGATEDVNSLTQTGFNTDLNSQVENLNANPKSYQSSYSYHKSWERQGDPYVIKPSSNGYYDGQSSQKLTSSTKTAAAAAYGSHYQHSHQSEADCDENGHIRVARSYNIDQYQDTQQQSQNLEDLGQQVEDLGQQTQELWGQQLAGQQVENLGQQTQELWGQQETGQQQEDLGQQTQELWGQQEAGQQLEDLGQKTQDQETGQQAQNTWDHLENLSQQSQNNWDNIHKTWDNLEDLGQKTQDLNNQFSNLEQKYQNDLGQSRQDTDTEQENKPQDQQIQEKWDSESGYSDLQYQDNQKTNPQYDYPLDETQKFYHYNHRQDKTEISDSHSKINAPLSSLWDKLDNIAQQTINNEYSHANANSYQNSRRVQTNYTDGISQQQSFKLDMDKTNKFSQNIQNDTQINNENHNDIGRGDIGPDEISNPVDINVEKMQISNKNNEKPKSDQEVPLDQIKNNYNVSKTNNTNAQGYYRDFQRQENLELDHFPTIGQDNLNDFGQNENLQEQLSFNFGQHHTSLEQQDLQNFGQQDYLEQQNIQNSGFQHLDFGQQAGHQDLHVFDKKEDQQDFNQRESKDEQNMKFYGRVGNYGKQIIPNIDHHENTEPHNMPNHEKPQNSNHNKLNFFGEEVSIEQQTLKTLQQNENTMHQNFPNFDQNKNLEHQSIHNQSQQENKEQQQLQDFGQQDQNKINNMQNFTNTNPKYLHFFGTIDKLEQKIIQSLSQNDNSEHPAVQVFDRKLHRNNAVQNISVFREDDNLEQQQNTHDIGNVDNFDIYGLISNDQDKKNIKGLSKDEKVDQQKLHVIGQNENLDIHLGQPEQHEQQYLNVFGLDNNQESQNMQHDILEPPLHGFGQNVDLHNLSFNDHDGEHQNLHVFGQDDDYNQQQNIQNLGQDDMQPTNLQVFGQDHNSDQQNNMQDFSKYQNLNTFGKKNNLEEQNIQDLTHPENLNQQNLEVFEQDQGQQNTGDSEQIENTAHQNLQVLVRDDNLEQLHKLALGRHNEIAKHQNKSEQQNVVRQNLQNFTQQQNLEQESLQDLAQQHNLEQESLQDFVQQHNSEQESLQDSAQKHNLEQQSLQDFAQKHNLEQQSLQDLAPQQSLQDFAPQQSLQDFAPQQSLQEFAQQQSLQDFAQQQSLQDFAQQQSLQDFAQQHNLEQQSLQNFAQQNLEQQSLQDFGLQQNLDQQSLQDFDQQQTFDQQSLQNVGQQESLQDFGQQQNLDQVNLQHLSQQQSLQDFSLQQNLEQLNLQDLTQQQTLQDFGQQQSLEQQNLQDFAQLQNSQDLSQQQNVQDFGQQQNLEQQSLQDFGLQDILEQQNLQDFGQHDYLEQQNLQNFRKQGSIEDNNNPGQPNLGTSSRDLEQNKKYSNEQEKTKLSPKHTLQSELLELAHPEERAIPIADQKLYADLQSITPQNPYTEVLPIEPVTKKPGFWKSVGSKLSSAKKKITSWFHSS